MAQPLLKLYEQILSSANVEADENGQLTTKLHDGDEVTEIPYKVDGRRVMLPTAANLRHGNWSTQILFHPLSEQLHRGESKVFKKLRLSLLIRMSSVFSDLLLQLTQIAANKDCHEDISPKAAPMLSAMPEADAKTVEAVEKIIERSTFEGANRLLSLHIRRSGKIGAVEYSRAALFTVSLLEEIDSGEGTVFGVKLRKKDYTGLRKLVEYIFPDSELTTTYGRGSRSLVAPNFDALCRSYAAVMERLNKLVKLHKKQLHNAAWLTTDLDWLDDMDKIADYDNLIPPQEGNIGDSQTEKDEQTNEAVTLTTQAPTNVPNIGNEGSTTGPRAITMDELAKQIRPEQPTQNGWGAQQSTWGNQPANTGWGQQPVQQSWNTQPARNTHVNSGQPANGAEQLQALMAANGMGSTYSARTSTYNTPPPGYRGMSSYETV